PCRAPRGERVPHSRSRCAAAPEARATVRWTPMPWLQSCAHASFTAAAEIRQEMPFSSWDVDDRAAAQGTSAAASVELEVLDRVVGHEVVLVVVAQLLTGADVAQRVDPDVLALDQRDAVGVARMVDEARDVAADSRVDARATVQDEQERVVTRHAL